MTDDQTPGSNNTRGVKASPSGDLRSSRHSLIPSLTLPLILLSYVILALLYAWATPPMEASDEYKHVPVIQHIKETGRLVVLDPDNVGKWQQEGAQPPLYYWVVTPFVFWIDTSDFDEVHVENRHAYIGDPNQIYNKNILFHERAPAYFQGTLLMVTIGRLISICMGALSLWLTYRLGKRLFSDEVGLFAVAFLAVNPMFLFISSSVNNDNLSVLIGAWGLLELVKLWQDSPDPRTALWRYLYLGLICGLGGLTKLSLATLLLLAGFVTALRAWHKNDPLILFYGGLSTFILSMGIVSPWLWRNFQLYGDPIGLNVFIEVQGVRDNQTFAGVDWIGEFGSFYRTLWGLFGGVNVLSPEWFYNLMNGLVLLALVGWVFRNVSRTDRENRGIWIPTLMLVVVFGLLIRWTITYTAFQGRLMFPAITGGYVLLVPGLSGLIHRAKDKRKEEREEKLTSSLLSFLLSLLFVIALILPFTHIRPAYRFPEPVDLPAEAAFGPFRFEAANQEAIELVGVEFQEGQVVDAGGRTGVDVTLYWQADTPLTVDYVSGVHLLGRDLISAGQVDRHPGWGMWPPTRWETGEIYADQYRIWANSSAEGPTGLRLSVSLFDSLKGIDDPTRKLMPTNVNGEELTLVLVGDAKLSAVGQPRQTPQTARPIDLADFVTFEGYSLPESLTPGETESLTLFWRANGQPSLDYTVFVQLLDQSGTYIAGADAPPLNGDYPTTLWANHEQIVDTKYLSIPTELPPGPYQIAIGFYDPETGQRMGRLDGGDAIIIDAKVDNLSN